MIAALPLVGSAISTLAPMLSPQATTGSASTLGSGGPDFSRVIADFSKNTIDSLKSSEATAIGGIEGKNNIQSVVEGVMSAQESLQTALAIRDKAVAAFQEVSRMAI